MADQSEQPKLSVLWPLLVVFLLVAGYIQLRPKLESTRPAGEAAPAETHKPGEAVRARLWEDPISAVERAPQPSEKDLVQLTNALENTLKPAPDGNDKVLILPTFLDGSPYPDDVETRLQMRYAVLSALWTEGFVPIDAMKIH